MWRFYVSDSYFLSHNCIISDLYSDLYRYRFSDIGILFHTALFYRFLLSYFAHRVFCRAYMMRSSGLHTQPVLTSCIGDWRCYSAVFHTRKKPSYQNVAFLSQILGDSSGEESVYSFRMLARFAATFAPYLEIFVRAVFSEIAVKLAYRLRFMQYALIPLHSASSFRALLFSMTSGHYSAIIARVQYTAVAQSCWTPMWASRPTWQKLKISDTTVFTFFIPMFLSLFVFRLYLNRSRGTASQNNEYAVKMSFPVFFKISQTINAIRQKIIYIRVLVFIFISLKSRNNN